MRACAFALLCACAACIGVYAACMYVMWQVGGLNNVTRAGIDERLSRERKGGGGGSSSPLSPISTPVLIELFH